MEPLNRYRSCGTIPMFTKRLYSRLLSGKLQLCYKYNAPLQSDISYVLTVNFNTATSNIIEPSKEFKYCCFAAPSFANNSNY
jgi:hypothetical protein